MITRISRSGRRDCGGAFEVDGRIPPSTEERFRGKEEVFDGDEYHDGIKGRVKWKKP